MSPTAERRCGVGARVRADFGQYDVVVIVTDHSGLDRPRLLREAKLIVDTRDALRGIPGERQKIYGL